jgi:hypothetical protein
MLLRRYDPPWPLRLNQHCLAQSEVYQPVASGVLDVLPKGRAFSSMVAVLVAGLEFVQQIAESERLAPSAKSELVEVSD